MVGDGHSVDVRGHHDARSLEPGLVDFLIDLDRAIRQLGPPAARPMPEDNDNPAAASPPAALDRQPPAPDTLPRARAVWFPASDMLTMGSVAWPDLGTPAAAPATVCPAPALSHSWEKTATWQKQLVVTLLAVGLCQAPCRPAGPTRGGPGTLWRKAPGT